MQKTKIVMSEVDWKSLKARVRSGNGTPEDARILLESSDQYRKRIQEVHTKHYAALARLQHEVSDFNFCLKMAAETIDPARRGLYFSQFDLFKCVLEPQRLRETKLRIAEEYIESLRWRAAHEEECAKRREAELAKQKEAQA